MKHCHTCINILTERQNSSKAVAELPNVANSAVIADNLTSRHVANQSVGCIHAFIPKGLQGITSTNATNEIMKQHQTISWFVLPNRPQNVAIV
jgi:hypothetical protein